MATHCSILSWRIPGTEEPGGLQSMESQRIGRNWVTDTRQASLSFTVSQSLLTFISIESVMLSNHHLILCCPLLLLPSIFPSTGSFPMNRLFTSGGQSIEASASASASVLPMKIQGWFPLGLTYLIALQSNGPSRIFSSTSLKNINSSVLSLL